MKSTKKNLPLLILGILAIIFYFFFYSRQHPQKIDVVPQTNNLFLSVEPEDGRSEIISAIKSARREILIEVYLLSDRKVLDAIEESHDGKVAVNIILECHPFGGGNINKKTIEELKQKKINNKCASDRFSLTHEKAIIIDGETAYIMTQNLATSSFEKNREYDVRDADKKDVDEIRNIYLSDWNGGSFTPTLSNIIESPNNSRAGLATLINSASSEIDIEMEVIDDTQIINLLQEKAKSIKVNLILPTIKQIAQNKKEIDTLKTNGVNVKTISTPYMHAKMILVDLREAYIGSINLTSASIDENRELGIILSQSDIINKLQATFLEDWGRAGD